MNEKECPLQYSCYGMTGESEENCPYREGCERRSITEPIPYRFMKHEWGGLMIVRMPPESAEDYGWATACELPYSIVKRDGISILYVRSWYGSDALSGGWLKASPLGEAYRAWAAARQGMPFGGWKEMLIDHRYTVEACIEGGPEAFLEM